MIGRGKAALAAVVGAVVLLAACGGGGLSRAEVDQAIADREDSRSEMSAEDVEAAIEAALMDLDLGGQPKPGMSLSDVESAIQTAIEDLAETQGLSRAEVEDVIQDAISGLADSLPAAGTDAGDEVSAPPKSDPAAYTEFVVEQAIARYEAEGLEGALAYYNDPSSVDEEWYVFIIDDNDIIIGHFDPGRRGLDVKGWVGTDINNYNFGPQMLAATEAGRWVPYVYVNPSEGALSDEGAFELKNAWVVRHDGLLFGSGWYINTEDFVPQLLTESAEHFRTGGLDAILEFYSDPQSISAGLVPTVEYYNSADTLDGYFAGFIAAPDGQILQHLDPSLVGTDIEDLLGPAVRNATTEGAWITADDNPAEAGGPQTMRVWVIDVDGTLIGGGWYSN